MKLIAEFFNFMIERELIRLRRAQGRPRAEWTKDWILSTYSFTNVKRQDDRTTKAFKAIYDQHTEASDETKLINCALYRFFGTEESAKMIGWVESFDDQTKTRITKLGPSLSFTSAYIITSAGRSDPKYLTVLDFVESVSLTAHEIVRCDKWEDAVEKLKKCYGVGSFMAKEIYLDFMLATGRIPKDWETYTPVGPGGKRGASRVAFGALHRIDEEDALTIIKRVFAEREKYWRLPGPVVGDVVNFELGVGVISHVEQIGEAFDLLISMRDTGETVCRIWRPLWKVGAHLPELDLTDIQFQMCEFDKYSRVAEGRKPKRLFKPR